MLTELLGAAQSVQALSTLLKAANGLANYNEIVAKVSEVNTKLMQANAVALGSQEKQASLSARVQELEQEVARLKDWQAEAQKYEALEIATGLFAYVAKGNVQKLPSTQKLCANCFEQRVKSLLQQQQIKGIQGWQLRLDCHRCKSNVTFRNYIELPSDGQSAN